MFNKMKKFLALTLTVLMLINALPVSALGEMASEWISITYSYDDDSEGASLSGRTLTLPVYFYDNVRGELIEKKTSIQVDNGGIVLSSSANILSVLNELNGDYASAVLADDDSTMSSGTAVSYLRLAGNRNNYYLTSSAGNRNPSALEHEGMNLYVRFTPAQPAVQLPEAIEIATGESREITADLAHADLDEATIIWTSSSSDVVVTPDSADPTKVTIKGEKTAQDVTITVSVAVSSFNTASASMNVDVVQGVTDVSILHNGEDAEGKTFDLETGGKQITFTAFVSPDDASDKTITWTSSNPAVASVSGGVVTTGNTGGSATISAVASNGVKASAVVHTHAFSLEVEPAVVNIVEGEEFYIYPLISSITSDWTLTAVPADPTVALANWNKTAGEAVITAAELAEGVESASTAVTFTLTHTVNGETESKSQTITVNVSPKAETEYFTISLFDMSGVLFESTSVEAGGSFTLPTAEEMAVEGYTFNGFKDLESEEGAVYSGAITDIRKNMILMADYTIMRHKVSFVVHDGEGANPGTTEVWVDHGDIVARPANPEPATENGYVVTKFIDWHDHDDHLVANSYDFWKPVTGDITLYAHFEEATFDVMLVTFAGTYKTYTYSARNTDAVVKLLTSDELEDIPVTLPESADIEATHLGGYYTDKDEDATERKWSYFRFWQIAGTSSRLNASSLDYRALRSYAYDETTGEWHDVIINAVYEPNTNGGSTRPYQSLNVTVPVRVITEDGYVLGMGEVYTTVDPSFGKGKGSSTTNGYNTTKVTDTTAKFGTVNLNGLDVAVTDSEGETATYTIIGGEDGNLVSNVELVWLCQMAEHVYGAMGSLASTHYCAGGCWNVLGIATVMVRLHSDDVRLRVNYFNIPEGGSKADAVQMKSLFFGDDDGRLENGDVLTYLDYVDGIGQTYSYHSHDWIVGSEGAVAQNGNSYVLNIYYTHWPHTVTVNYVYEDGTTAASSKTSTLHKNTYYFITSPEIEGYVPDVEIVRGKMPGHNLEFTVTYYALGHLQITKKVVDSDFDPENAGFSFLVSNAARTEAATASIRRFTQNSDGSWTGTADVALRAGRYSVQELNVPDEYIVSYSAEIVALTPENTASNPAKVTVTNTAKEPLVSILKETTSTPANGEGYALGEEITYQITVSNTGTAAAENVVVIDELTGLQETIEILAAGAAETIETSYIVTEADILKGSVVNVATADGKPSDPVEDETEEADPQLTVEKTVTSTPADGAAYALGEEITYQIVVKNTGNLTVSGITVSDDLTGDSWTIASLAVGESASFTAKYTVTAEDIAAGRIVNTAEAAGKDPSGGDVKGEDSEEVTPEAADPQLSVNKVARNARFVDLSGTIAYQITVTNTGNVIISDIVVTDDLTGDDWLIDSLQPGEYEIFTTYYTVTEADIAAGKIVNTAEAAGKDPSGKDVKDEDSEEVTPAEPRNTWTVEKSVVEPKAEYALGEEITYQIVVTNTGNQPLTDLEVTDARINFSDTIDHLAVGASETFTGSYTVTKADITAGEIRNIAYADDVPSNEVVVKTEEAEKSWTIEKSVVNRKDEYKLGDTVTYRIEVKNTGNQDLENLVIKDELVGLNQSINLAVGAVRDFTRTYTVTEADIAAGRIVNIAYAGDQPSDEVEVKTEEAEKSWTIEKSVVDPKDEYALGDVIAYQIVVKNTGNQSIEDLRVTDALINLDETVDLAVGESETFTGSHTVTEADIAVGEISNIAFAGDEPSNEVVVETEEKNESWTIEKREISTPANNGKYALGEQIRYEIEVKNTGNQTITDLRVKDALLGLDVTIDHLIVGASEIFTGSYTVTEADIINGAVINTAYAGDEPSNTVTVETEDHNPDLYVEKTVVDEKAYYELGETIQYQIIVKNTGNVTQNNIAVKDALINLDTTIATLAIGAAETFTGSYTVQEEDIIRGYVRNVATAGDAQDEYTVDTEEPDPSWTVSKTVPGAKDEYKLGETIRYRIVVRNTGNIALEDIHVVDELIGLDDTIDLAIGAAEVFTGSYTVQEVDILRGYVYNVVTAGNDDGEETDEHTQDTEELIPNLTVVKAEASQPADGEAYQLGETIRYTITVRNGGNVRINDITVTDDLTGDSWSIDHLHPGDSETFTASHVVSEADIASGSVVNVATAKGTDPAGEEVEGEDSETVTPEEADSSLIVDKETLRIDGRNIYYKITVSNAGNQTIRDVRVDDALTGDSWTIRSLSPGGVEIFYAEYTVAESDIIAGSVVNTATAKGTDPTGKEIEGEDEVVDPTEEAEPAISIEKKVIGQAHEYELGEIIRYQIIVKNTGNLTLTNVHVVDELVGLDDTIDHLSPGGIEIFDASYAVTEADLIAGSVLNVAAVKAESPDPDQPDVEDEDEIETDVEDAEADLHVIKTVTSTPANGEVYVLGEEITYAIRVHNGGSLTMKNITVTDELTGDSWEIESLAPGMVKDFTASHIVTEADLIAGSVVNVAAAKGETDDPDQPDVEEKDEIETEVEDPKPSLDVEKTITSTPADGVAYDLGEKATFRIVVTNTGNLTITDIVVKDDKTFNTWEIESLAPGDSREFTTYCYVVDEDGFLEKLVNIAVATGKDPTGEDVQDSDSTEDPVKPARAEIQVEKTVTSTPADGVAYKLGEEITYEIVVSNTGNLRLLHVSVEDELTGDEWYFESMPRYTSRTVTASHIVTEADLIAGKVLNVVTAQGETNYPELPPVEDEDDAEAATEPAVPAIDVIKTVTNAPADGAAYKLGEEITYQIAVKNSGNLTVKNITVADELTGDAWTIESLAPGAEKIFTAKYTVTEADTRAGKVVNVATAAGGSNDPDQPTVEDEGEVTVEIEPNEPIVIRKASLGRFVMNVGDCFE